MKIGFTSKGPDWSSVIDARFGRARYLLVYDDTLDILSAHNNEAMMAQEHGAGPGTASKLFEMQADVLVTGNGPGDNAASILKKAGIQVYTGAEGMKIKEAYTHFKNNKLNQFKLK